MTEAGKTTDKTTMSLMVLIVVQGACGAFFLADTIVDFLENGTRAFGDLHLWIEVVATLSLIFGIIIETRMLMQILRRKAHAERGLSIASGALHDLMESYFADWKLTRSEADVATFAIKGLDIAEIAALRGSAEGTVKAHLNAIYRKSGTSGRGALVGLLVEDLMGQPLVDRGNVPTD